MAAAMMEEPFKTVALPPPGLGDRPPCSRTGFGQTDQGSAHCVGRTNASSACSSSGIDYPRPLSISPHDAHERRGRCQIPLCMSTHLPPMTAGGTPAGRTGSRLATGGFPYPVRPSASLPSSTGTQDMDSPTGALAPRIRVGLIHHPRKTPLISARSKCVSNAL